MNLMPLLQTFWGVIEKSNNARIAGQTPTAGVMCIMDVPYVDDGMWQHTLDVYYPENTDKPLPVIIDIHGGGWVYGTKRINQHYDMYRASLGYTVFSINYRLVPDATVGDQITDCMTALAWIAAHLQDYPCDSRNVYLSGDSAGGYLAAHTAIVNTSAKLQAVYGVQPSGLTFRAVSLVSPVPFLEGKGFPDLYYRQIRGADYKNSTYYGLVNLDQIIGMGKMPPTFLVTSRGDYVAHKPTQKTYRVLKENGIPAQIVDWKKANNGKELMHVFSVTNPEFPESVKTVELMLAFFKKHAVQQTAETLSV